MAERTLDQLVKEIQKIRTRMKEIKEEQDALITERVNLDVILDARETEFDRLVEDTRKRR